MPRTDNLPYDWWDPPNIHFCTIKDFRRLCSVVGARMEKAVALNAWGRALRFNAPWWFWNLLGEQAVFLLSRGQRTNEEDRGQSSEYGIQRTEVRGQISPEDPNISPLSAVFCRLSSA